MMVEKLVGYLQPDERELLNRLRAYLAPTFADGVCVIAQDLTEPERLLRRLVGLSLVEVEMELTLRLPRYRLSPVVADWLQAHDPEPVSEIRQGAAQYQLWVHDNLLCTLEQALIAHEALRQSGLNEDAAWFASGVIVPNFIRMGLYHTLLKDWLPTLRENRDQKLRACALNLSGNVCLHVGRYDEAQSYFEEFLAIQRVIGNRTGEGAALSNLAQTYQVRGDYETAQRYLKESLVIQRTIGDQAGEGAALNNLSQIYQALGDYDAAQRYLEKSLAIRQAIGDQAGEGITFNNLSQIYQACGDYDTARRYLEKSLAIQQAIGDRASVGATFNNLSTLYHACGNYGTALHYLEKSLAIQRAIDNREGLCTTMFNIGYICWQTNKRQQAVTYWVAVYRIAKEISLAATLMNLEKLAELLGGSGLEDWERLSQQMESGE